MSDLTPHAAARTAVFSKSPATPAPASTPTAAPTTTPTPVEPHSHAGISETEAAQIVGDIRADVAKGKITPEEATKRFDAMGVPPDQRTMSTDLRDEEQRLIDEHFPAAKPADYQIRYSDPGQPVPPMTKELAEFDSSARAWLVGAEFPANLGNSLIDIISKVAQQTKHMDETQLEHYGFDEFAKLERVYGKDLDAKLHAAARMVEHLEKTKPGLKNLLRSKGIGDNALVVAQIIGQSERWHARRKGR